VFREGCCFLTDRPLETFELLQIDPWPGNTRNPIDADQIPARGFIGGEGQVGENVQGLTAVSGVAGGGGGPRDVVDVPTVGGQEGVGEVVRELPRDDVVLTVCLVGAKRRWINGTTARPSGGGSSSSPA
jgi:hypothetical protein